MVAKAGWTGERSIQMVAKVGWTGERAIQMVAKVVQVIGLQRW